MYKKNTKFWYGLKGRIVKILCIMKLTVVLWIVAFMQVSAASFGQTLTYSKQHTTLREVIQQIKEQTGYDVLWPSGVLDPAEKIAVDFRSTPVREVMEVLLIGKPLAYSLDDATFVIRSLPKGAQVAVKGVAVSVQQITVRGKVVDEKGKGLPGATIRLKGSQTNIGITSSESGDFMWNVPGRDAILSVSYIGYETKEVSVSGADVELIIRMVPLPQGLNEVTIVNTGYQEVPKERATGSFEFLNKELINRSNGANILSRLEGLTPSLLVDRRRGIRGAPRPEDMSIRGLSSMDNATVPPLIVLDNFPYDGDIGSINPNDVESITVLKDAAASSIWGARAGNGVIVITTKKGAYDRPLSVSVTANTAVSTKPDLFSLRQMSTSDWIDVETRLFKEGAYTSAINNTSSRPFLTPVVETWAQTLGSNPKLTESQVEAQIDQWRDLDVRHDYLRYVYRPAVSQQYALAFSGGARSFNYNISGGYDRQLQELRTNNSDRATLRTDFSYKPLTNLEISASTLYTQRISRLRGSQSPGLQYTLGTNPYMLLADEMGNPLVVGRDIRSQFLDEQADPRYLDWRYRPLEDMEDSYNTIKNYDLLLNLAARYKITNFLKAELSYQYGRGLGEGRDLYREDSYYTRNKINLLTQFPNGELLRNLPLGGILKQFNSNNRTSNLRGQINIDHNWTDKHQLTAVIGFERRENNRTSNTRTVYGYDEDNLTFAEVNNTMRIINFGAYQTLPSEISFSGQTQRFVSGYANAAYTYLDRYTVSGSARKDAANLFGVNTNQKGAPFWSAGASWEISKEPFYKLTTLPYLRLRGSYGYQGNTNPLVSAYSTIRYEQYPDFNYNLPYANLLRPANDDLRWERVGMLNLGLDFRLRDKRLSGSIEYYTKNAQDLLFFAPLGYSTGFLGALYNNTALKAKGFDLSLHSVNLSPTSRIGWTTDFFVSYAANRVTAYKPTNQPTSQSFVGTGITAVNSIHMVDKPASALFAYAWGGLDPLSGDPQGYLDGQISKDYNAIFASDPSQLRYFGASTPTYITGFRNTFTFKNISLSANITGKFGYYFRRESVNYSGLVPSFVSPGILEGHSDYGLRWQHPGDEHKTDVPSFIYPNDGDRNEFYESSAVLVEKGDHIRLQDLVLGYTLDKPLWGLRSARFFVNMNNLGLIWRANKQKLDPDYQPGYSAPRIVAIGLNANF